jgi:hypothetical protein
VETASPSHGPKLGRGRLLLLQGADQFAGDGISLAREQVVRDRDRAAVRDLAPHFSSEAAATAREHEQTLSSAVCPLGKFRLKVRSEFDPHEGLPRW